MTCREAGPEVQPGSAYSAIENLHLSPNFTTSPSSLRLGYLLPDPLSPDLIPLNRNSRLPINPNDLLPPTTVTSFSSTRKDLLTGRFGVWTPLLTGRFGVWTPLLAGLKLPMGADLGLFFERGSNDRVSEPDDVKGYLTERKYRVPVYIVTGVKIARGASVSLERTREADARVGVSGPEGVAEVKPLLQIGRNRLQGVAFDTASEFVLAFQVRRIKFARGRVQHELSLKGTSMLGDEREDVQEWKVDSVDHFVGEEDEVEVLEDSDEVQWAVAREFED
ncbi:hypothetical protein QC762_503510 [Podospora pseudocomata]|uniref:Uncharacterized protein n=1 Tax=Podospora pseudocomata TaxID=2093779 RepID=A0ABR0GAX4_9PEZI|nr:hypothetical protein QC762_503510 [Podospora pseudocomata]